MGDNDVIKAVTQFIWLPLLGVITWIVGSHMGLRKEVSEHRVHTAQNNVTREELRDVINSLSDSQKEVAKEIKAAHSDLAKEVKALNATLVEVLVAERANTESLDRFNEREDKK